MQAKIKDIISWDVRNWSKGLEFWGRYIQPNQVGIKILELGARNGGLSLWLATKGAEVVCSDVTFPKRAADYHRKFEVSGKIEYSQINALSIPYSNQFDIVCFKSVLGGVGRNQRFDLQISMMSQIYKALKPGGMLFFAENLQGAFFHKILRGRFVKWGGSWRYPVLTELEIMLKDFERIEMRPYGFLGALGLCEYQRNILGLIDAICDPAVPDNWKYIVFGIAFK